MRRASDQRALDIESLTEWLAGRADLGYLRIDPGYLAGDGGLAPAMLTLTDGDDFAYLSMAESGFDLSDRGVAGRSSRSAHR